jgi:spore coat polysaccharide biosynthesis protein SpsF (cytidylyltransferase family)
MNLIDELRAESKSQGTNKRSKIEVYLESLDAKSRKEWIAILVSYDHSNRAITKVLEKRGVKASNSSVQNTRARLREAASVAKK